jgi:tetratricopeptide (TPR) repeat protein
LRIQHFLLLTTGIALVAILYFFGVRQAPPSAEVPMAGMMQATASGGTVSVDFVTILQKAKGTLNSGQRDSMEMMEMELQKVHSDKEKAQMLSAIGDNWTKTGNIIVAGKYFADAAEINKDVKTWDEAATRFFMGFPNAADTLAKMYAVQEAIKSYEQLRKLDSTNMNYPIREALCYIDGQGQVMPGVVLLKEVEKKDPDNKDMNLILGRLAVVSGQYDKAVARLEKLITMDPNNAEAYFHLAEAYRALGRKDEAIKTLEHCKSLVTDEDFNAQIDSYINQIKNS